METSAKAPADTRQVITIRLVAGPNILTSPDVPTIYVSGDNASLEVVEQIAERFAPKWRSTMPEFLVEMTATIPEGTDRAPT
jgi:hypothetical protein